MQSVTIMRGLPGSGKSTLAQQVVQCLVAQGTDAEVVSADNFFMKEGRYEFDARKLRDAHAQCFADFLRALARGSSVIVDNTNTQLWEFENYLLVARIGGCLIDVREIAPRRDLIDGWVKRCVHGVPYDKVVQMFQRWETFDLQEWTRCMGGGNV
jgi:predicted kinase